MQYLQHGFQRAEWLNCGEFFVALWNTLFHSGRRMSVSRGFFSFASFFPFLLVYFTPPETIYRLMEGTVLSLVSYWLQNAQSHYPLRDIHSFRQVFRLNSHSHMVTESDRDFSSSAVQHGSASYRAMEDALWRYASCVRPSCFGSIVFLTVSKAEMITCLRQGLRFFSPLAAYAFQVSVLWRAWPHRNTVTHSVKPPCQSLPGTAWFLLCSW